MRDFLALLLILTSFQVRAHSPLGEKLKSSNAVMQNKGFYSVRTSFAYGREMHEYFNQDKIVFAISWVGRTHPDLNQILGPNYSDDLAAIQNRAQGRQPFLLKLPQTSLHMSGHMGRVHAYVYANQLLPAGFDLEILK
jgi:hypothetical protein